MIRESRRRRSAAAVALSAFAPAPVSSSSSSVAASASASASASAAASASASASAARWRVPCFGHRAIRARCLPAHGLYDGVSADIGDAAELHTDRDANV